MNRILLLFCLVLSSQLFGQISFNTTKHNFGDLEPYSARYVDIILSNNGSKQEWLLSVKKPAEVAYITSKQLIEKDSSIAVRLHVNPRKKGRFSYDVNIFTSDRGEATTIKLSGNISDIPQDGGNMLTACPTFNDRPSGRNPNAFDLTVVTIDKETREPLSQSRVTMIQGGQPVWAKSTDKRGKIKEESTLGLSYFYATHKGYYPAELGAYVNFKRNYVVVELERDAEEVIAVVEEIDTTTIADVEPEEEIIIEIEEVEEHLEEELAVEVDSMETIQKIPALAELDPNNFESQYFKPVNVIFVLDVSSSMKQVDKIELMKYALFQLTDMLRPQDRMGIVTYASDTRVLLPPTSGANKPKIKQEVTALKAHGYTSGGAGIKLGYKQALKSFLPNGENHVIVITDGAFNRNSDDYKKHVKKYKKKGVNLSVVGVKNKAVDEQEMRDAAQIGGGDYIPIFKLADAQNNLKQAIRVLTFKHP